jgi:hypothetical protein
MADITVTGQQAYFNEDAKFFKDVYIYGTLYYDFEVQTDNLVVDNLTVNEQLNLNNLFVSGISSFIGFSTFTSSVFLSQDLYVTGIATLGGLDVDNLIVGIATVQQRFELTDVGGTNYFVGFATGSYAGRVGIGSTLPEQKLDIGGAVRINTNIFDSVNSAGASGYYLSRDGGGIRWVAANPSLLQGIFVQNESVNVGVGSFTTLNFIGTRSGGDIVNVTADGTTANIDIIDHWTKNGSGIHTTANVGINVVNPSFGLDVGADAYFRNPVEFESAVFVDAGLIVSGFTTGTISTALFANVTGFATNAQRAGFATFADFAGISTFSVISGFSTNSKRAGFATFSDFAGISTFSVISGFSTNSERAGFATFSDFAGISTYASIAGFATNAQRAGFATFSDFAGISTYASIAGFATNAQRAGFSTFSDFAGISTFSAIAGFATNSQRAGFSTFSDFAGISTFASTSGVSTNVQTVATSTNKDYFLTFVENSTSTGIETVRVDSGITYNPGLNALGVDGTLEVGIGGSVITTTGIGSVGFGSVTPTRQVDFQKDVRFQKAIYDVNDNVGFRSEYYQVPRNVLTTVGVDTSGNIIGGRFYDAANLIRINLDFIANEAIGFLTSTDYKNPAFTIVNSVGVATDPVNCKDDIKDILKAITYDITRGGNSRSVGAGLSYYTSGGVLQHITGTDLNGYSVKEATIVAITTAAQVARYVINNLPPPKSYQGIGSIPLIKDLTLQNDPNVGFNTDPGGCANVVSAITVSAGIVTNIIQLGASAFSTIGFSTTFPNGKVVWAPAGADSRNIIYVSKYGNDDNNGRTEGSAKLTIGAAAAIAQPGDTIMVRSGVYAENNPIGLRTDVSVSGQDLRLVTIYPQNDDDVFYVRRGCLIENLSFAYSKDPYDDAAPISIRGGAVAFPPPAGIGSARSGFLDVGPCNEGPSGRWRSPYIRNCTNFMTNSIGMKINGNHVSAAFTGTNNLGQDLKCMVCDSFTQYNENGIGVSITNNGYAQLVSIFTINCNVGVYCDTGGSCDITNSNSSFGNYGLYANGVGAIEFTGITTGADVTAEQDTYVFTNVRDTLNNVRKPFDGQALFFKIDLADYNDVGGATGIVTAPLRAVRSIRVTNGGSGYSETAPPNVTISAPGGPEAILAELSANVSAAGTISSIDVIASGRNFLPDQPIIVSISGSGGATAEAIMDPIYFTVNTASEPTNVGLTTVTFNEFIPYSVGAGTSVEFRRISRIITSNISFEYIGAGVDINRSNPFQGGVPVPENEVVAINGGQVPFTSTDQKGNFRIGSGLTIDQTTATISGRDFNRAIQANLTPLILALGG